MERMVMTWTDDGTFRPLPRHAKACDKALVVGQDYVVEAALPRNMAAHRAYFAEIAAIWKTLPEGLAEQFPSSEHLRKYALCKTGYCTESRQVFTTPRDAIMAAAFAAAASDYSVVDVVGNVVRIWKPMSQDTRSMDKARFDASKRDVLDFLAGLIGVTPEQSREAAGEAA